MRLLREHAKMEVKHARSLCKLNRILSSERCRLLPGHTCQLMQLAVEGPRLPDVHDAEVEELVQFSAFLETAYVGTVRL